MTEQGEDGSLGLHINSEPGVYFDEVGATDGKFEIVNNDPLVYIVSRDPLIDFQFSDS